MALSDEEMLNGFRAAVESRRSIRVYNGDPIPESTVLDCLRMAMLAPNSSNLQPWQFYWVRNEAKKQALVRACLSQPAAKTAAELIVVVARTDNWRVHAKDMLKMLEQTGSVPHQLQTYYGKIIPIFLAQGPLSVFGILKKLWVSVYGLFKPMPRGPFSHSDMRAWAMKSTTLAAAHLMLAARAHGFDSCPMEGFDATRVRKILNLPWCTAEVVMVVSLGRRAPAGVYGPRMRFDETRFIHQV